MTKRPSGVQETSSLLLPAEGSIGRSYGGKGERSRPEIPPLGAATKPTIRGQTSRRQDESGKKDGRKR